MSKYHHHFAMLILLCVCILAAVTAMAGGCGKSTRADEEPASSEVADTPDESALYTEWPFDTAEARRRQQETADRLDVPKDLTLDCGNGVEMTLMLIPAGEFEMGSLSSEEGREREERLHRVQITQPFYVSATEITQAQYEAVAGDNPSEFVDAANPVDSVSWEDAVSFCQTLTERTGRTAGLPTEAQWEYVCRAGTDTPFHTGETISTDQANYDGNYTYGDGVEGEVRKKTIPAGSLAANAWGLYDMHGNVWEWCTDWYGASYYAKSPSADPQGPDEGKVRVLRGGSWYNSPKYFRSAARSRFAATRGNSYIGFRVIVDIE